jgi:hypothetical protein
MNDPQDPNEKIKIFFPNKVDLRLSMMLFTRTDPEQFKNWKFEEGSHEKRLLHLADTIAKEFTVQEELYYYQTEQSQKHSDRWIIFIGKQVYRFDPYAMGIIKPNHRMDAYLEMKLKKMHGLRMWTIFPWNIWDSFNIPLYRIKKANLQKINNLPAFDDDPMKKYFKISLTRGIVAVGSAAITGVVLGLVLCKFLKLSRRS